MPASKIPAQEGGGQDINLPVLAHGAPRTYALLDYDSLGFLCGV